MTNNAYIQAREAYLAPYATHSTDAIFEFDDLRHRDNSIPKTPFERDREFIFRSSALKKLGGKSQNLVFRTLADASSRLFHTLQVTEVASRIAQGLHLNIDLTEAIALGHDIGHMPFSHNMQIGLNKLLTDKLIDHPKLMRKTIFEDVSDEDTKDELRQFFYLGEKDKTIFAHQKQSFHVLRKLEPSATETLTINTQVGILHNYEPKRVGVFGEEIEARAISFEMLAVELADYIAWPNNDLDEAIKKGFIGADEVYSTSVEGSKFTIGDLGTTYEARVSRFIEDVIEYNTKHQQLEKGGSVKGQAISLSPSFYSALNTLKDIIMQHVLEGPVVTERAKIVQTVAKELMQLEDNNLHVNGKRPLSFYRKACDDIWQLTDYEIIRQVKVMDLPDAEALQKFLG